MWMWPLAYGGPSCSTNFGAPRRWARIFPYRISRLPPGNHLRLVACRFAFMGKSVRGRFTVFFQSAM